MQLRFHLTDYPFLTLDGFFSSQQQTQQATQYQRARHNQQTIMVTVSGIFNAAHDRRKTEAGDVRHGIDQGDRGGPGDSGDGFGGDRPEDRRDCPGPWMQT